jgi:hypothetical protein
MSILASWNEKIKPALRKAVTIQLNPTEESFPELPDVLVWVRAILAVLYGCYVGYYQQMRGGAVVFQALNLLTFVPYFYCKFYLGASAGVFDMQIMFGGTPQGLCLFLLVWIYFFTAANSDDEAKLAALLLDPDYNGTDAAAAPGNVDGAAAAAAAAGLGDASSEF